MHWDIYINALIDTRSHLVGHNMQPFAYTRISCILATPLSLKPDPQESPNIKLGREPHSSLIRTYRTTFRRTGNETREPSSERPFHMYESDRETDMVRGFLPFPRVFCPYPSRSAHCCSFGWLVAYNMRLLCYMDKGVRQFDLHGMGDQMFSYLSED